MTRRSRLIATTAMLAVLALAPAGCLIPVDDDDDKPMQAAGLPNGAVLPNGMPANGQLPGALGALRNVTPQTPLGLGESKPLNAMFLNDKNQVPVDGVVWTSSNEAIVQVNPTTGIARGAGKGTAIVTVTLQADPSVKAQVTVNVSDPNGVSTIRLTPPQGTIAVGDKLAFRAEVVLGTGEVKSNVIWSSSDESIARVDASGNVTAKAVGTAQILATFADDPVYKGQAFVRVVGTRAEAEAATPPPTTPVATAATSDDPGLVAVRKPGTWVEQTTGTTEAFTFIKFFDLKAGVVASDKVLLNTSDAGTTWKNVPNAAPPGYLIEYAFEAADDGWIVGREGIKKYNGTSVSALVDAKAAFGDEIADAYRSSKSKGYVLTAVGAMYETDDGGKTWDEVPTSGAQPKPTRTATPTPAATATPTPEPTATPTDGAAYRLQAYNFQSNWSYYGLSDKSGTLSYGVTFSTDCKNFQTNSYYTCSNHYLYTKQGSGWKEEKPATPSYAATWASSKEAWRLPGQGAPERTVDGGQTWLPVQFDNGINVGPRTLAVADTKTILFGGPSFIPGVGQSGGALVITENGGRTWRRMDLEGVDPAAITLIDPDNIWVAGSNGKVKRYVVL